MQVSGVAHFAREGLVPVSAPSLLKGLTFYVFQVTGSSGTPYTLFPHVNFCSCPAYRYQVISTQKFLTCKHILAARLAEIMQKGRDLSLSVEELTRILCAAVKFDSDGADHDPWSTHLV